MSRIHKSAQIQLGRSQKFTRGYYLKAHDSEELIDKDERWTYFDSKGARKKLIGCRESCRGKNVPGGTTNS